jgi:hypothetical protein
MDDSDQRRQSAAAGGALSDFVKCNALCASNRIGAGSGSHAPGFGARLPLSSSSSNLTSRLAEMDAYEFVSQNAKALIAEMVDPEYTVMVKIDKKRLLVKRTP